MNRIAAELLGLTAEFGRYVTSEIHGTPSSSEEVMSPEEDNKTC
jgi:hypothetical protein